jgi:hypothetical protein
MFVRRSLPRRGALLAVPLLAAAPLLTPGSAQAQDADLAFWQSIQNSTNPEEYRAYLRAFPNGRFAELAKIRIERPPVAAPAAAPAPGGVGQAPAAPETEPPPDEAVAEKIVVDPLVAHVGQQVTFTCQNINDPDPQYPGYDRLVVVAAGTPDFDPNRTQAGIRIIWEDYMSNIKRNGLVARGGPFAPGRYEVRYYTTLYNNEHKLELRTKTPFSVR